YELDKRYQISTDKNNVAPRLSLAWDPFKDHKTVVRAGYGIFYAPNYLQIDRVARMLGIVDAQGHNVKDLTQCTAGTTNCFRQIAQVYTTPSAAKPANSSNNMFQTLFLQG